MDRNRQNHGQEHGETSYDHCTVAKVLVARAAVFDAYVGWSVYGAWAVVAPTIRRPSARPDNQQLAVHCNSHFKHQYYSITIIID